MANLEGIIIPEKKGFETEDMSKLMNVWRQNHRTLLDYIMSAGFPYFGLHGTNAENLSAIQQSREGHLEMATFYDKERSEKRLFQLYQMCIYVAAYTKKNGFPGGILVFNLEEDGNNVTVPWEKLKSHFEHISLSFDNEIEKEFFKMLRVTEHLLWRTDKTFDPEEFNKRYKGAVQFSESAQKYFSKLSCDYFASIARSEIRQRFLGQDILAQALKIVTR